jgi:transporter family-2 protein
MQPSWTTAILYALAAAACGAGAAVQIGVNSKLRSYLESPFQAALVSFVVGTIVMTLIALIIRAPLPSLGYVKTIPWYLFTGGLLGATFVTTTILLAPRLGSASLIAFAVTGQLIASLTLDHFGLLGFPQHEVSPMRIIGAILLLSGAVMIKIY